MTVGPAASVHSGKRADGSLYITLIIAWSQYTYYADHKKMEIRVNTLRFYLFGILEMGQNCNMKKISVFSEAIITARYWLDK